jgi:hypothetical protein
MGSGQEAFSEKSPVNRCPRAVGDEIEGRGDGQGQMVGTEFLC